MTQTYLSLLLIISLVTVFSGAVYRFYRLDYFAVCLTFIFTAITFILLKKLGKVKESPNAERVTHDHVPQYQMPNAKYQIFLLTSYFLLLTFNFFILFQSSTSNSVISPWQAVPWYFWLTFFAITILLIAIALKNSLPQFVYFLLLTSYFLLAFNVAVIIFKIGFGFDPFIHQATEKLIDAAGAVYPKPWYYLGQYALIVIFHKLTFIPIVWLDKLLVPVLATLTLPYALYQATKSFTADERIAKLTALFALIFPFAAFTLTTPQNLANLFLLLIILLFLIQPQQNKLLVTRYSLLVTLSFAALATHPIAGIPAVLFVAFILGQKIIKNKKILTSYFLLLTSASALSLPLAFYLNNQNNPIIGAASDTVAKISWHLPQLFFSGTENFLLNFIYLYGFNVGIIIITFIIVGIIIAIKQTKKITRYPLLVTRYSLLVTRNIY